MPIKKAAKKYLKVAQKNRIRNTIVKKRVKDIIKKAEKHIAENVDPTKINKILREAQRIIDRAAQKNVIKKNTAARKKRHLYKKLRSNKKK
ncbi:MAG: 30S ribosomal protein S20 [Candidatus Moranbacteria bacterium]|nr:30S ribosomal protein S20 [Candidatus Moranbacteria bacterium]